MDVRILGALDVRVDGMAVDLGVRKTRACLGLLALHANQSITTARLAEGIWPQGPPPRWESALQSHISRLRAALEPDRPPRAPSSRIETRGDAYVLRLADDELDARRFELAAAQGRAALARAAPDRAAELLAVALAEWRGPLLADVADAAASSPDIGRLDELRLVVIEERAEAQLQLGMHAIVVADLEGFVREYPLRERGWELLLLALYRSGRQADALRRFQDVRKTLVNELGIEPGPGLRTLEGAILRQEPLLSESPRGFGVSAPGATASVALPMWLQPVDDAFVGRKDELSQIAHAAGRIASSARRLVLIEGEPGIGKTRLAREACRDLVTGDVIVLGGRCIEEPLHVLQPFAEAVGRLAISHGDRLAQRAPAEAGALASLVPELAENAAPLPAVDADAHRYLVFRAVSRLLDRDVVGADVVLVLDDLQWAPAPTLQLLAHLLRDDERGGLLVLATVRDTEPNDEFEVFVADLQRERRVERLRLEGLDPDDVVRLVAARGAHAQPESMFAKTEGNPFYVEELVRHFDESDQSVATESVPES
ncbi:MAG TPA: BTAD domain-containing putative transcriptional regulator, partial [Acidimicrobiia bacterium]|nr:BTAD domain-containing putative transcriptional regulator [Acidimicrobiia bacterium]